MVVGRLVYTQPCVILPHVTVIYLSVGDIRIHILLILVSPEPDTKPGTWAGV